jgi:hypothetical protein
MAEVSRQELNVPEKDQMVLASNDLNDNKSNDKSQNDDDEIFQPSLIIKKYAEYAAAATKVLSLPGLAQDSEGVGQFSIY